MRTFLSRFVPFIFLGVAVVILVAGLILVSYVLLFGALVGLVLFLITWIKEQFFPVRHLTKRDNPPPRKGRTFDHDDH